MNLVTRHVIRFLCEIIFVVAPIMFLGVCWGIEGGTIDDWKLLPAVGLLAVIFISALLGWKATWRNNNETTRT